MASVMAVVEGVEVRVVVLRSSGSRLPARTPVPISPALCPSQHPYLWAAATPEDRRTTTTTPSPFSAFQPQHVLPRPSLPPPSSSGAHTSHLLSAPPLLTRSTRPLHGAQSTIASPPHPQRTFHQASNCRQLACSVRAQPRWRAAQRRATRAHRPRNSLADVASWPAPSAICATSYLLFLYGRPRALPEQMLT
jgi:hypothetical protein